MSSISDYLDSSFGGWPYNSRGADVIPNMGGLGPGGNSGGAMGTKPAAGTAGLGLSNLKRPTSMTPAGPGGAPPVGPNPLANGGQGPSSTLMRPVNMGGAGTPPSLGPVTGNAPGGPIVNPVDTGIPVPGQSALPQVNPPNALQGGPMTPPRSAGFGGIRPLSSY